MEVSLCVPVRERVRNLESVKHNSRTALLLSVPTPCGFDMFQQPGSVPDIVEVKQANKQG